jgi:hypothetical protein
MMKRIVVLVAMLAMMVFLAAPAALALSCDNVSRQAPKGDTSSGPIVKGHWVWLPSIGVDEEAWGFVPPGTEPAGPLLGKPNGNYTNGKTHSLLGVSANCDPSKSTARQSEHGVQTGCF